MSLFFFPKKAAATFFTLSEPDNVPGFVRKFLCSTALTPTQLQLSQHEPKLETRQSVRNNVMLPRDALTLMIHRYGIPRERGTRQDEAHRHLLP